MYKQLVPFALSIALSLTVLTMAGCASGDSHKSASYKGLGRDSVDEKTLQKYAAPTLDSALSRKIQSYLDIRAPGMGILSPDKNKLFFSWRVTGTTQVWRMDRPKGFPIQMTGGEDSTSIVGMTNDGKWLVISRDRNGEENPGIYLQSTDGGPLKVIQHKAKVQTIFQGSSDDGKVLYYRANDVKADSYALYRYDIEKSQSELLFSDSGYWMISDHLPTGKLLLTKALTNVAAEVYEFDIQTKQLTAVIGQGEKEDYTVRYGAKPGQFLVLTPKLGEFRRLYTWDLKDLKPVTPELKWDVSDFAIDHSRQHILYEVNEGGYTRLKGLDAQTFKSLDLPKFPTSDHVSVGSMSRDGRVVMLGVENPKGPRTSYSYDFEKNILTQWVLPSQPEVDTRAFVRSQLESFPARDGVQIPYFVRRPDACVDKKREKPCPVVIHFHGGPEGQSTAGFSVFAQMFVDENIIFVEPNVRGSEGYGKSWLHSDNGARRLNVLSDIEDAAIFVKKNWSIKGEVPKVGIMGWSYGGYSTLIGMSKYAGAYDAGVALVGMSNLLTFLNNTAPYRRQLRIPEYGDPEADKDALRKLSPVTYLEQVKSPLMIIQGATDPRVPVGEAVQFHEALTSKKIPSSLIIFADEGHGTDKRSNKVLELGHALRFLKENLQ